MICDHCGRPGADQVHPFTMLYRDAGLQTVTLGRLHGRCARYIDACLAEDPEFGSVLIETAAQRETLSRLGVLRSRGEVSHSGPRRVFCSS